MGVLPTDSTWVNDTLSSLTIDQKIAQLLHGTVRTYLPTDELVESLGDLQPGGMFMYNGSGEKYREITDRLQQRSDVPVIISSDLECGAGRMIEDATSFPNLMGVAAADDEGLAYTMGESAAQEGRRFGVHWAFGPVVDINANPHNPITNIRSFGDNPNRISRLARAVIKGMQDHGMAATIKHFPGDGFDDRDQHLCTTINPLTMEQWLQLSGRMFKEAIDAGVWTIMTGHIALPAFDPGKGTSLLDAPPATLSRKLTVDLLREELGFDGLIITDAIGMGGIKSWEPESGVRSLRAFEAGADMILFSELEKDFSVFKQAYEEGKLTEERIDESVRRILALKEKLGLNADRSARTVKEDKIAAYGAASEKMAHEAITVVNNAKGLVPMDIGPGKKVLAIHVRAQSNYNVDTFNDLLRETGAEVDVVTEEKIDPYDEQGVECGDYDVILILALFGPTWATGHIRWGGTYMRLLSGLVRNFQEKIAVVSFASPYHIYELPDVKTYINAYSGDPATQRAVVDVLLGKEKAVGASPVDIERLYGRTSTIEVGRG